mgnify:CR=1 FL=1
MKLIIVLFSMFILTSAQANPYIEIKNELPFVDLTSQSSVTHYRLGYKFDNNMYVEAGPMTNGNSFEIGYKFKRGNWTFKGKFEGKDKNTKDFIGSKVETEIRYTFGD